MTLYKPFMTDADLLHRYARNHDQTAFAELVRLHADLVYTAARRQLGGNHHHAQEVTQMVFLTLAALASPAALATATTAGAFSTFLTMNLLKHAATGLVCAALAGLAVHHFTATPQPAPAPTPPPSTPRPASLAFSSPPPSILHPVAPNLPLIGNTAAPANPPPASPFSPDELRAWRDEATRRRLSTPTGESVFKTQTEVGLYIAYLNRAALALENDFPVPPSPPEPGQAEDPARAAYAERLAQLQLDADLLIGDGAFEDTLVSRDPARIATLQTAFVAGTLGLDLAQESALASIITAAYTEGFARGLSLDRIPEGDTRAWQHDRAALNAAAIEKTRALLTPAQRDLYDQLGWNRSLIFLLKAGHGLDYATDSK
jgi:hypothetical protein